MTDAELTRALERGEIDNKDFHHASHLHVVQDAGSKMRETLRHFAAAAGKVEKYHETITLFWIYLLAQAHAMNRGESLEGIVRARPELLEKHFPLTYYSRSRLFSDLARATWVEPDLKPLML